MNLSNKIEAVLFFKGEPVSVDKLSEILNTSKDEIFSALLDLSHDLESRGLCLVSQDEEYSLGTRPELSDLIESIQKEELNKNLSKASIDTLAIIVYKNGASKSEIDYIRGVNSGFTLRALSIRGLVEKTFDPKDSRKHIYKPTSDLLQYLGISKISELPGFDNFHNILAGINSQDITNVDY